MARTGNILCLEDTILLARESSEAAEPPINVFHFRLRREESACQRGSTYSFRIEARMPCDILSRH